MCHASRKMQKNKQTLNAKYDCSLTVIKYETLSSSVHGDIFILTLVSGVDQDLSLFCPENHKNQSTRLFFFF